jgi:hypothetical protein
MAFVPLQIPPGLSRNNTPFDTPSRWWDMNLIRFVNGSMLPIGGWNKLTAQPAPPVQANTSTSTSGGTLAAGTYYYVVTAYNGGGETLASNEKSQVTTGSTSSNVISWATVNGATGYRVYRGTAAAGENVYYDVGLVLTYTDTNAAVTGTSPPPIAPAAWALDSPVRKFNIWRNNIAGRMALAGTDARIYVDNSGAYTDITPPNFQGPGTVQPTGGFGTGLFSAGTFGTARTTPSPIFSPYGYHTRAQWGEDVIWCANTDGRLLYFTQSTPLVAPLRIGPSFSSSVNATITAALSGATLTVSAVASGTILVGDKVVGSGMPADDTGVATILSQLTGSAGSTGTYHMSVAGTVGSETMHTYTAATTGAPISNNAVVVTAERHVMAIGYGGNARSIAWSSREDPTDWNFSSTTNSAGFLQLVSRTPLLSGYTVAEGTLVFSYTDVFLIRYLGQPYVYGGTEAIAATSLYTPDSIAVFDSGKAVWLGRNGFQMYAGGYVQQLPCPFLDAILGGTDQTKAIDPIWGPFRCHASANGAFPEVWFFYPSVGNSECNRYVVWNYLDNTWMWGSLNRSAMAGADAYKLPYMGSTTGDIYEHETGLLDNGSSRVGTIFAETGELGLGENSGGTTQLQQLRIASGNGYASVECTVYGRYTPEGQEYTEGPFLARDDGYMDARADYMHMRLRFVNAKDDMFAVGKVYIDADQTDDMR